MAAFTFYSVVLTIHILAVVLAFGVVFAYPIIDSQMNRAGPAALPNLHRLHLVLATRLVQPAMTVVLLAGLYLALRGPYSLGDPWISATFAILIVLFGLTGALLIPADKRLLELAERDLEAGGERSAGYVAESRKADTVGSVALLLVVVAVFLMTTKPGM
jgi:uncharacterized membrane protein